MIKQNINIVGIPILYNILEEIKDNLSFGIKNFYKIDDYSKSLLNNNLEDINYFILTDINNKNFFLNKKANLKKIFFLSEKKNFFNENYNIIHFPIDIYTLIEKINVQLIKFKFNFQSKIIVKKYSLDLNSRTISRDNNKLKLTEREMEIIIFLNECETPQKISDLQNKVWGYSSELETHTVETHVYRLRKKIKDTFNDQEFLISTDAGYCII